MVGCHHGLPRGLSGKEPACQSAGDVGSTPGLGRSLGVGHSNPFQYSGLENLIDRGAWWSAVNGIVKSQSHVTEHNNKIITAKMLN